MTCVWCVGRQIDDDVIVDMQIHMTCMLLLSHSLRSSLVLEWDFNSFDKSHDVAALMITNSGI